MKMTEKVCPWIKDKCLTKGCAMWFGRACLIKDKFMIDIYSDNTDINEAKQRTAMYERINLAYSASLSSILQSPDVPENIKEQIIKLQDKEALDNTLKELGLDKENK